MGLFNRNKRPQDAEAQNNLGYAYEKGQGVAQDYAQAVYWYRKAAEQGYAMAQSNMGVMYENGKGVEQDYAQAARWYRKAAEQGYTAAQYSLGYDYDYGLGVEQDYKQAAYWYRKAADQGHVTAQNNLGVMYAKGLGVAEDYAQAVYWYRKAAEQGYAIAQNNLGFMYDNGRGVEQDYAQAARWYRKAAEQGYASAQFNLGYDYEYGLGVEQDYKQAVYWYRKAAEQGHEIAQNNLGVKYEKGLGVTEDYAQAVYWYRKAAEQGYAIAQNNLGIMYDNGKGVAQDYVQAASWYRKAAEQGHAKAQNSLGYDYEYGVGVEQDYKQSVYWYLKAAEQGYEIAQNNLGVKYEKGLGVTQDYTQAVNWYRKAAEQGYAKAQNNLGIMYDNGKGVTQDYAQAARWYRKAAEQGYASAQFNLGYDYAHGEGVEQDYAQAAYWYRQAAEQNNAGAQSNLGLLYENGKGVERDLKEALRWLEQAIANGNDKAKSAAERVRKQLQQDQEAALAKSTPQPKQKQREKAVTKASPVKKPKKQSTPVSSQKADAEDEKVALLKMLAKQQAEVDALKAQLAALQTNKEEKKAAEQKEALPSAVKVQAAQDPTPPADQGEREAAYNLALMYSDGNGDIPKDYLKALELFCKAADQGHEKAQKILRSFDIHRAKTSYNVPVSHKPNLAEKKNYENKRHIKVAVIGDCLVGKTTLLSALSCYFSQNYPSYENYYMTREEIKEIQSRGAHGLCKEHNYQHEPFYMFLEDPDFLYTFIEIPSVLDFMKNIQQGMYAADIAIYVATVQNGAANSSKYLQLALNAGIPRFIAFQTTLEPNPDQDLIDLTTFDLTGAASNFDIPLEHTIDGTHLEYQIDEKDFTLCLAKLVKAVRDEAAAIVGYFGSDLPTLMSIKKVSRKRDGSLLALGVISRGTLHAGEAVEICGYYDTLIPATCAEIQIFNLSVQCANNGDLVSVRLTDLPSGFVIRAGQFISKPGCIRLANSITIDGKAPTWEDGGRHTPFFTGYQPLLIHGPSAVSAKVTEIADEIMVTPGTHFTLRLDLDKPLPVIHGLRAVLCDGVIVGTGKVSEYSE